MNVKRCFTRDVQRSSSIIFTLPSKIGHQCRPSGVDMAILTTIDSSSSRSQRCRCFGCGIHHRIASPNCITSHECPTSSDISIVQTHPNLHTASCIFVIEILCWMSISCSSVILNLLIRSLNKILNQTASKYSPASSHQGRHFLSSVIGASYARACAISQ